MRNELTGQRPAAPALTRWEEAYQAFETPAQELRKFVDRLRSIGADGWDRDSRVLEVFSGRGTGLQAWHALGFRRVVGVDYSAALVFSSAAPGLGVIGDARRLPFASDSVDIAIVQNGLHHLEPADDVGLALSEMRRVLTPQGRMVIIEPWLTPFLRFVHAAAGQALARRLSRRLRAFQALREAECKTYDRWLATPAAHLELMHRYMTPDIERRRLGKLVLVGSPKAVSGAADRMPFK